MLFSFPKLNQRDRAEHKVSKEQVYALQWYNILCISSNSGIRHHQTSKAWDCLENSWSSFTLQGQPASS